MLLASLLHVLPQANALRYVAYNSKRCLNSHLHTITSFEWNPLCRCQSFISHTDVMQRSCCSIVCGRRLQIDNETRWHHRSHLRAS